MESRIIAIKTTALFLAGCILLASCSSKTLIQSNPSGAKVYLNGEAVGTTPYTHEDTKIVGSTTTVKLEKEGYETFNTSFSRNEKTDVGAIIGGVFVLFPFLWTMKYKPERTYDLVKTTTIDKVAAVAVEKPSTVDSKTKADKLRELKKLLEEKLITQEEYDLEKKKVLAEL
ncbi:PEGA domain-containing protein [Pedobacter ureilyticus]|uniref:PEGA domain-containing protein n=1 Tax=Pedobacter ureilyticus TaxID=1393051 RepID=A0ABW9J3R2_9SPHI|nr:PEGA domain-containing protein [Pedobacter helvus]